MCVSVSVQYTFHETSSRRGSLKMLNNYKTFAGMFSKITIYMRLLGFIAYLSDRVLASYVVL